MRTHVLRNPTLAQKFKQFQLPERSEAEHAMVEGLYLLNRYPSSRGSVKGGAGPQHAA